MKIRFPLYAKILSWFFLNLLFLGVTFFVAASLQFKFGLDSLVAGRAGERFQTATQLLMSELRARPEREWTAVLKQFSDAYKVQFFLFHNGEQLAGAPVNLPAEVKSRMVVGPQIRPARREGPDGPPPEFDDRPEGRPPPGREARPPLQMEQGPPRFMVHTTAPSRYWVVMRATLPGPERQGPMPVAVAVMSETLSAGGLLFDVTPWVIGGIAVIFISVLFWIPLVRGITRSISKITTATGQIAEGQFDVRLRENRKDELGQLGEAINRMAGRLSGFVTGQKRFLGDIAHELCSPLARIQVSLGILEQRADEKQKAGLEDLREEVEQMSNLVNELLSFSKASIGGRTIQLQTVSVRQIVDRAISRECLDGDGIKTIVQVPDDLHALGEPELLLRAVGNILRNAIRYAGHAGPITLSASRDRDRVLLTVEDCGPGIPPESLAKVFDPFYRLDVSRTRDTGGAGLGLSIVKTCVESCGGTVGCENRQPAGLRVNVKLAAADEPVNK